MSGIALIPARGGSRRIPRKNVRPFLGEPALARVVRTIHEAGIVDRVLVSTDDDEIADVARGVGAEIPGRRPAELADDHTTTIDVVRHAIDAWLSPSEAAATLWVIYPTAVLLAPEDLHAAAARFHASDAAFLVSVLAYPHPVERRLRLSPDGLLRPDEPDLLPARTQDLRPAFHDAGQFYVGAAAAWRRSSPLEDPRALGHILAPDRAVDIDGPEDWARAERYARSTRTDRSSPA